VAEAIVLAERVADDQTPGSTVARPGAAVAGAGEGRDRTLGSPDHSPWPLRWLRGAWHALAGAAEWLFGLAALIVGLSVLATIPLVQFASLGYLLEASARIARSGRLRDGLIGVRTAARLAGVVLGAILVLLPVWVVSQLWYSSQLISGDSQVTRQWRGALLVLAVLAAVQCGWACFRGGRLRHFLWPAPLQLLRRLRRGGLYAEARDRLWEFVAGLHVTKFLWLGLRGFVGALFWLWLPVTLMVLAARVPPGLGVPAGLLGAALLALVIIHLPFLQTRLAAENRFGAMFEVRAVRALFARAPLAFAVAVTTTLAFAVPLYALKAELVPREAAWLPSLAFVLFALPSRFLTGWAMARASRRADPRHGLIRWPARLALLPIVASYVLIVYFTQYVSWYGGWSLYEQHAFLVPVPFLGM